MRLRSACTLKPATPRNVHRANAARTPASKRRPRCTGACKSPRGSPFFTQRLQSIPDLSHQVQQLAVGNLLFAAVFIRENISNLVPPARPSPGGPGSCVGDVAAPADVTTQTSDTSSRHLRPRHVPSAVLSQSPPRIFGIIRRAFAFGVKVLQACLILCVCRVDCSSVPVCKKLADAPLRLV